MLVTKWMKQPAVTIDINDSMDDAIRILNENKINMLPVMKKGKLKGIITDRDLKKASASDATSLEVHELIYILKKIKVKKIMTEDPITVPMDFTIDEVAAVLLKNRISGMPVVNASGKVVGVITKSDVFKALISITGIGKKGIQFALKTENKPGSIKDLADVIREFGGRMIGVLGSFEDHEAEKRTIYMRMHGIDRNRLEELEKVLKKKATLLYTIDHRENIRKIY